MWSPQLLAQIGRVLTALSYSQGSFAEPTLNPPGPSLSGAKKRLVGPKVTQSLSPPPTCSATVTYPGKPHPASCPHRAHRVRVCVEKFKSFLISA